MKAYQIEIKDEKYQIIYISNQESAINAARALNRSEAKYFGCDIETGVPNKYRRPIGVPHTPLTKPAGLDPYRSFISLFQVYDNTLKRVYVFDCVKIEGWEDILRDFIETKKQVYHNAIFDVMHLMHNGFRFKDKSFINCSMIMYYLVRCASFIDQADEEEFIDQDISFLTKKEKQGGGLKSVVAKLLGIYVEKEPQTSNWTDRPLTKEQVLYAAKDVIHCYQIAELLQKQILEYKLARVYKLNREAIHVVARMQLTGIKIDTKAHAKTISEWNQRSDILVKELTNFFGPELNINSSTQLSKFFKEEYPNVARSWELSASGKALKTDAKTLKQKVQHIPELKTLLEYKKLEKMITTYGQGLLDKICPETNRLHGSFSLGYTHTGRLSSREPNLQNFSREDSIRTIFIPEPGNVIVGADYSQIEIRILALLSGEPRLLKAFRDGLDVYRMTAALLLNKSISQVTKPERQIAKSAMLGIAYGLGSKGLGAFARDNYGANITDEHATKTWYKFFEVYPIYEAWQHSTRKRAEISNGTTSARGKYRALSPERLYTIPVNHPIQAASAEITISALNRINRVFSRKVKILSSIHDEILLEVSEIDADKAGGIMVDQMRLAVLDVFPKAASSVIMNDIVDYKTGMTWAATK